MFNVVVLTLRTGTTWGTSDQADHVLEQVKIPMPVHEVTENPAWPNEATIWEKWLYANGFVEVEHAWVDEALLSTYKQQTEPVTDEALSLFEFSHMKKLKLRSCKSSFLDSSFRIERNRTGLQLSASSYDLVVVYNNGKNDLACLIHFTNYACGPEKRIHGGAIIAALAKPIGLRTHLPAVKEGCHLNQVSALQVNFLSGVLQDSVGLVTMEEVLSTRETNQGEVTITASLRSLLRDESKEFPRTVDLAKTKLCATATGKWFKKPSCRM